MVALALCIACSERIELDLAYNNGPFGLCTLRMNGLVGVICGTLSQPIERGPCRAEANEAARIFRMDGVQGNHKSDEE